MHPDLQTPAEKRVDELEKINAELVAALEMFIEQYGGPGCDRASRPEIIAATAAIAAAKQAG